MSIQKKLLLSLCISSIIAGSAAYYFYDQTQKARIAAELSEQKRIEQERLKQRQERRKKIQDLYDTYLNDFTNELREEVREYRTHKQVLNEISMAINFETPELAKENYEVFTYDIAPALHSQINDIIMLFEEYQSRLENEVKDDEDKIKQTFLRLWKEKRQELLPEYIDSFARETKIINAYEELIKFYYTRSNLYDIDIATGIFLFDRDKDFEKHKELQKKLKDLKSGKNSSGEKQ